MTGGNQLRLSSTIGGTILADAIMDRFRDGAVVAGTSAGASAMSSHMIAFGASGATPKHRMAQIAAGLGVLPGVIVDQHFQQRNRLGRLLSLIAQNPSLLGLGRRRGHGRRRRTRSRDGGHRARLDHGRRRLPVRDGRLGGPRPPAAHDQRRRPALAAGRLPLRPSHVAAGWRRPRSTHCPAARPPPADPTSRGGRRCRSRRRSPVAQSTPASGPKRSGGEGRGEPVGAERGRRGHEAVPGPGQGRGRTGAPTGPLPTLRVLETRVLRGPNYWAREPVIRQLVDLGVLEEYPSNLIPDFIGPAGRADAQPRGARLLARSPRRVHQPAARGHVGRPHRRARRPGTAEPGRHGRPPRQDPGGRQVRPVQLHLRVQGRGRRPRGRADGRRARELPRRRPTTPPSPSTTAPRWSGSSASPSARRSGRRRRPSSTRP